MNIDSRLLPDRNDGDDGPPPPLDSCSLSRVHRTALLILAALAAGCGATQQPATELPPAVSTDRSSAPTAAAVAAPPPEARPERQTVASVPEPEPIEMGQATLLSAPRPPWQRPQSDAGRRAAPQPYEHWRQLRALQVGVGYLSMLDLSEDERFALVVSEDDAQLRLYDATSGQQLAKNSVGGFAQFGRGDFAFWPGQSEKPRVVYASEEGLQLLDGLTGQPVTALAPEGAWRLRWSLDRQVLGAALSRIPAQTSRLALFIREGDSLAPSLLLAFRERVDEWALDPTGSRLAVTYYPSETVALLDLKAGVVLWSLAGPKYAGSIDISPDGRLVAVGGDECWVMASEDPERRSVYRQFENNIHQVRFSPSGDALAVSSYDGRVRILGPSLDAPTLPLRKTLRHAGTANVYALRFTRDGSRLWSSSGDRTVRIWGR